MRDHKVRGPLRKLKSAVHSGSTGELLESRILLSITPPGSEKAPITSQLVGEYGTALFGEQWQTDMGMTAIQVQGTIADGTWRALLNGNDNEFVSEFREIAQTAGRRVTQAWFNGMLDQAELPRLAVARFDWFQEPAAEPLASPMSAPDAFLSAVEPMATPLIVDDYVGPIIGPPDPTEAGEGGTLEVIGGTAIVGSDGYVPIEVFWDASEGTSFTVHFETVDGTAEAGVDYEYCEGIIEFTGDSEGNSAYLEIPIPNSGEEYTDPNLLEAPTHYFTAPGEKTFSLILDDVQIEPPPPADPPFDAAEGTPTIGANQEATLVHIRGNNDPTPPPPPDPPTGPECECECGTSGADGSEGADPNIDWLLGDTSGSSSSGDSGYPTGDDPEVSSQTGNAMFYQPTWVGGETTWSLLSFQSNVNSSQIITVDVDVPPGASGSVRATLLIDGQTIDEYNFASGSALTEGTALRISVKADHVSSGTHRWTMDVDFGDPLVRLQGESTVVNRKLSPYGKGWWVNGLDYLVVQGDDVTYISGNGYGGLFAGIEDSDLFDSPPGWSIQLEKEVVDEETFYIAKEKKGQEKRFNESGQLLSVTERDGKKTEYTYESSSGLYDGVSTITDPFGQVTTFHYETNGWGPFGEFSLLGLDWVEDSAGRVTEFELETTDNTWFDGSYMLTSIEGPNADLHAEFTYNEDTDQLHTYTFDGEVTTYTFDYTERLGQIEFPDGTFLVVDPIDVQGLIDIAVEGFDEENPADVVTDWETDATITDPREIQRTVAVDAYGRVMQVIDAAGTVDQYITSYEYYVSGYVSQMTQPDPDGLGPLGERVTSFEYDPLGRLTRIEYPDLTDETWDYDEESDRVSEHVDQLGRITQYEFDEAGMVEKMIRVVGDPDTTADPPEDDDVITEYTYTDAEDPDGLPPGLVLTVTDPLGYVTEYTYITDEGPAFGKLSTVTYAVGEEDEEATVTYLYYYDPEGENDFGNVSEMIDEMDRHTTYDYDAYNRLLSTTLPNPLNGTPTGPIISSEYDGDDLILSIDANGNETGYEYDERGRLWKTLQADPLTGEVSEVAVTNVYDNNGNLIKTIDQLGRITRYEYDSRNRLLRQISPDPDDPDDEELDGPTTTYSYIADCGCHTPQLQSTTDPLGYVTKYEYDIMGRLVKTILPDPDGEGVEFESPVIQNVYDAAGQLIKTIDALERETAYEYDDLGRLVKTILPDEDGEISEFSPYTETQYDKNGNVTFTIDAMSSTTAYLYDARNRQISVTLPDPDDGTPTGPETVTTYRLDGSINTVTDPWGRVTTFGYDDAGRHTSMTITSDDTLLSITTGTTYDDAGNVLTQTDGNGGVTEYVYDHLNRLRFVIQPDPETGEADGPTTETVYDDAGQVFSVIDARDNATTYTYDGLGRLTVVTLPDPDGPGDETNRMLLTEYDANGNVISQTDPEGNETQFEYDHLNRLITTILPDPDDGTPTGPETHTSYDAASQVTSNTDARGIVTSYEYDSRGRLTKTILPDPTGSFYEPYIELTYDDNGNLLTEKNTREIITTYEYDKLNRRTAIIQVDPDTGLGAGPTTVFVYNVLGQVESVTDPMLITTTYEYDGLGRLEKVSWPDPDDTGPLDGASITYGYDANGNLVSQTDGNALTTENEYDYLNRLTKIIQPPPVALGDPSETEFGYDANGNRISLIDPNENETEWEYDALNRVIREIDPLEIERHYVYDKNNNLTLYTDRNERVTRYTYDHRNRRTMEEWLDELEDPIRTIEWDYDAADRLTSVSDLDSASYTYEYDDWNRLLSTVTSLPGLADTVTLASQYDYANRLALDVTIGSGLGAVTDFKNTYNYDYLDRLTDLIQDNLYTGNEVQSKAVLFTWNAAGQANGIERYNDPYYEPTPFVVSAYDYDPAGRLIGITHTPDGASPIEHAWTYDDANRITTYDNSDNGLLAYEYDDQNQLVDYTGGTSVSYDPAGNRNDYDVDLGNQVASDGDNDYEYDAEGNLIRKIMVDTDNWVYQYDYRNRLVAATLENSSHVPVGSVYYEYDAFNRRVMHAIDMDGDTDFDFEEDFIYDGDNVVLDFEDSDGVDTGATMELRRRYLYGPAVDQILAQENVSEALNGADRVYWLLGDNQNTTHDLFDNAGDLKYRYSYTPFGAVLTGDTSLTRYLYTGREYDWVTGLQYNRNRWYDANLQRWMSQDPIGFDGQDENLYRYVSNGPTNATDPSGLVADSVTQTARGYAQTVAQKKAEYLLKLNVANQAAHKLQQELCKCRDTPAVANARQALSTAVQEMNRAAAAVSQQVTIFTNYVGRIASPSGRVTTMAAEVTKTSQQVSVQSTVMNQMATRLQTIAPNRLAHIFVPKHNLTDLVRQCTDYVSTYNAMTQALLARLHIAPNSPNPLVLNIRGINVTVEYVTTRLPNGMYIYQVNNAWIPR